MSKRETIDIHAHFYPENYLKLIAEDGAEFGVSCAFGDPGGPVIDVGGVKTPPLERRYYDLEARVAAMDEQGVDVHVLSLTQPMVDWASADLSRRLPGWEAVALVCIHGPIIEYGGLTYQYHH